MFNCTDSSVVAMLHTINCGSICQVTAGGGGGAGTSTLAAFVVLVVALLHAIAQ
jgi:MYXO-CTERM domain-containing protein